MARLAAEAGLFNSCAKPAESFPKLAKRSICCSYRVVSRIRSDIWPTRRWASSRILCTKSGNMEEGNFRMRPSVTARPAISTTFIREKGSNPVIVARLDWNDDGFATQCAPQLHLPFKDYQHPLCGTALLQERITGLERYFLALADEPIQLIVGQTFKRRDAL